MRTDHLIALIAGIRQKAHRFIAGELERAGMPELAPSHGAILSMLYEQGPLSMRELAERIDRDKSTVTVLVGKLAAYGYVRRSRDPQDRRVTLVSPTAKAQAMRPEFEAISRRLIRRALRGFSRAEQEVLVRGLKKLDLNW